ncbi:MAG TPA: hypothetical protein VH186_17245 [Chloroflexia bacterium]|nr:hypothetical protein [Chloroflexia bacterium]
MKTIHNKKGQCSDGPARIGALLLSGGRRSTTRPSPQGGLTANGPG